MKKTTTLLVITFFMLSTAFGQTSATQSNASVNVAKNINTRVNGEALHADINTPYKEFGPMATKDGTRLYFSRQGYPGNTGGAKDEDIWYSDFDPETQSWKKPVNPGPPLNNTGPNFITGIGINGDTLLLANIYRKNGKMMAGASVSVRTGALWSFPTPVNVTADYNFADRTSYDLSHDRTTLIIAEEKVDSRGKLDLYVSFRDPDRRSEYAGTESINLGQVINTTGDETSPWLAYDGKTLYFASNGHAGFGKLDIFVSKRLDDTWTNWSTPQNLGPGINSAFDDLSFNYNPKDRYAYYSRGFSSENTDIFRIEMTELFLDEPDGSTRGQVGQTKLISNVFDDGMTSIKKEGTEGLNTMIDYLKKHNTVVIMINAHSNIHSDRSQSFTLSNERAQKIFDYLVSNGIDKNRLSFNGLGHDIVASLKKNSQSDPKKINEVASSVEFKIIR